MQTTLGAIIGENQSAAIKNNNITQYFPPFDMKLMFHIS